MNQLQSPGHKKAYLQVPPLPAEDIPMLQKHSRDRSIRIPKANSTEMIKKVGYGQISSAYTRIYE
ncbi:hypothetical protein FHS68_001713 [Dyadobacter arcticus]|uniref:Uncharacterized protein n=1 Tax=Dyadobacter arcticus TaxID=1078754 RepID=A0ABX0UJ67_9BACT|nr:hypothetical protein [Dyadobacter arcticus]